METPWCTWMKHHLPVLKCEYSLNCTGALCNTNKSRKFKPPSRLQVPKTVEIFSHITRLQLPKKKTTLQVTYIKALMFYRKCFTIHYLVFFSKVVILAQQQRVEKSTLQLHETTENYTNSCLEKPYKKFRSPSFTQVLFSSMFHSNYWPRRTLLHNAKSQPKNNSTNKCIHLYSWRGQFSFYLLFFRTALTWVLGMNLWLMFLWLNIHIHTLKSISNPNLLNKN